MNGTADLSSAAPPAKTDDDHVRGTGGHVVILYGDYECPYCARTDRLLAELPVTSVFRHFPIASKHPRAQALACAAEAAARQGAFWPMHDALMGDQGHVDDPHLWARAAALGLDLERFNEERRSEAVAARVARDFRSAVRAGAVTTPTIFLDGRAVPIAGLVERLETPG